MRRYTAGFNGNFPTPGKTWNSVESYLKLFDNACAINACTLIPNGNVRMEAMGLESRKPTADELKVMKRLVREGMEQGAVGVSSGLDYVPSIYADEDELTALCEEIAPFSGIYVTHMRGYNLQKAPPALQEVFNIGKRAQCGVHVSHFNCVAEQTIPLLDAARAAGVDVTYDLYCYLFGSTLVVMLTMPPEILEGGLDATMTRLADPVVRKTLEHAFANPRFPIETIRLASLPSEKYRSLEGMGLVEAAKSAGQSLVDFTCDLLLATNLAAGCIIRHFAERQEHDIPLLMKHPLMMGGSDGIYIGGKPHPRHRLLRPLPRPPCPQRRLVDRRSRDEVRSSHRPPLRVEGSRPHPHRPRRGSGRVRPRHHRRPFDVRRRQDLGRGRRPRAGQRRASAPKRRTHESPPRPRA